MENIIEAITSNPVYLAIAVALAVVIVYGFVKKIIKLALVTVSVFILYVAYLHYTCLLYTSPSPRDRTRSRMPSSA